MMQEPTQNARDGERIPFSLLCTADLVDIVLAAPCLSWPNSDADFERRYAAILLRERGVL